MLTWMDPVLCWTTFLKTFFFQQRAMPLLYLCQDFLYCVQMTVSSNGRCTCMFEHVLEDKARNKALRAMLQTRFLEEYFGCIYICMLFCVVLVRECMFNSSLCFTILTQGLVSYILCSKSCTSQYSAVHFL